MQRLIKANFAPETFATTGIPDMAFTLICEYYAFDAQRCPTQAKQIYRAFAAIGFRTWIQRELDWTEQPTELTTTSQIAELAIKLKEFDAISSALVDAYHEQKRTIDRQNEQIFGMKTQIEEDRQYAKNAIRQLDVAQQMVDWAERNQQPKSRLSPEIQGTFQFRIVNLVQVYSLKHNINPPNVYAKLFELFKIQFHYDVNARREYRDELYQLELDGVIETFFNFAYPKLIGMEFFNCK